jgi:hypothetical protein
MLKSSVAIFNYWNELRGSRDAPLRSEISPASIRGVLPDLFILEATPANGLRFRLAGTGVCNLFGRELRDQTFASLWSDGRSSVLADAVSDVMARIVPVLANATGYGKDGRQVVFEIMLLPLRSTHELCDRVLGCLTPVQSAPWLGAEPLDVLTFDRSRLLAARPAANGTSAQARTVRLFTANEAAASAAERSMSAAKVFGGGDAH